MSDTFDDVGGINDPAIRDINPAEDAGDTGILTDAKLSRISMLGLQLVQLQSDIKRAEAALALRKAELFKLSTETIPLAMDEVDMAQYTLTNGYSISVNPFMQGSIPAIDENKPDGRVKHDEAIKWLRENGHEGIIKRELSLSFKKGQDELAQMVRYILDEIPELPLSGVEVEDQETVHHSTLKSWAKEMQEENLEFPAATLGLYIGRTTKVELTK